jgi:hypothetical protein
VKRIYTDREITSIMEDAKDTYISSDGNWGSNEGLIEFNYALLTPDEEQLLHDSPEDFYSYLTGDRPLEHYLPPREVQ